MHRRHLDQRSLIKNSQSCTIVRSSHGLIFLRLAYHILDTIADELVSNPADSPAEPDKKEIVQLLVHYLV